MGDFLSLRFLTGNFTARVAASCKISSVQTRPHTCPYGQGTRIHGIIMFILADIPAKIKGYFLSLFSMNFKPFLQETHPFMQRYVRAAQISLSIFCHPL
jgi:hypothetical protein